MVRGYHAVRFTAGDSDRGPVGDRSRTGAAARSIFSAQPVVPQACDQEMESETTLPESRRAGRVTEVAHAIHRVSLEPPHVGDRESRDHTLAIIAALMTPDHLVAIISRATAVPLG